MKRSTWIFIAGLIMLCLTGATGWIIASRARLFHGPTPAEAPAMAAGGYQEWPVSYLKQQLARKEFTLINVHVPFEGRLAGTDLEIAYDQITTDGRLPKNKEQLLVLYCRSGRMSDIAANALVKAGYTHVVSLKGGMLAWEEAGYKLDRP